MAVGAAHGTRFLSTRDRGISCCQCERIRKAFIRIRCYAEQENPPFGRVFLNLIAFVPRGRLAPTRPGAIEIILSQLLPMTNTKDSISAVKVALTAQRITTYEAATRTVRADDSSAIALYAWNAAISATLLAPLHICEVVIRNAISEAIES